MSDNKLRGKKFDDGVVRYYDPTKHSWRTEDDLRRENSANNAVNLLLIIATVILCGGGFLYMVIAAFG